MRTSGSSRWILAAVALVQVLEPIRAQTYCNGTSKCPESTPCCSQYGYCGTGSYCMDGCEPLHSFQTTSCRPDPICQSMTSSFSDLSRIQQNASLWDGNVTQYDWIVNTGSVVQADEGVKLILTESNSGTKISSTRYIHYGKIDFTLETSKWAGVVTAAITMSDVKDEIDWEFTGTNTTFAQTNYWFLGIANYSATEGLSVNVDSDTSSNFHTYTFDWQESYLNWMIDGNVVRTVNKQDTCDSDGECKYPSTPSQIQISIWPAGISSSAPGTVQWAGGYINWQDPDYESNGYFWNTIQSVQITCAEDANQTAGTTGWSYSADTASGGGVPQVLDTNASVMLNSGEGRVVASSLSGLSGVAGAIALLLGASIWFS